MGSLAIVEFEPPGSDAPEPDYYSLLEKTQIRLQEAGSLRTFCQVVTDEVRALTGLDRVMVYRFHPDQHGEIYAESRRQDLVRDNGAGIAPRDVDKIFTMFKRLSQEPGSGPGHGVGMAIVKKLVARYGGDVWVTSTRGAGSTFYFDLPDSEDSSPNNVPAV